jgi:hypothetical protein
MASAQIDDMDITHVGNDFMYVSKSASDGNTCVMKLNAAKAKEVAIAAAAAANIDISSFDTTKLPEEKPAADVDAADAADAAKKSIDTVIETIYVKIKDITVPDLNEKRKLSKAVSLFTKLSIFYSDPSNITAPASLKGGAQKQAGGRRATKKQRVKKNKSLKKMTKKELIQLLKGH